MNTYIVDVAREVDPVFDKHHSRVPSGRVQDDCGTDPVASCRRHGECEGPELSGPTFEESFDLLVRLGIEIG